MDTIASYFTIALYLPEICLRGNSGVTGVTLDQYTLNSVHTVHRYHWAVSSYSCGSGHLCHRSIKLVLCALLFLYGCPGSNHLPRGILVDFWIWVVMCFLRQQRWVRHVVWKGAFGYPKIKCRHKIQSGLWMQELLGNFFNSFPTSMTPPFFYLY